MLDFKKECLILKNVRFIMTNYIDKFLLINLRNLSEKLWQIHCKNAP